MPDSLYGARLQGIMVVVFIKPCARLSNDEYNYHDSLKCATIVLGLCIHMTNFCYRHTNHDTKAAINNHSNFRYLCFCCKHVYHDRSLTKREVKMTAYWPRHFLLCPTTPQRKEQVQSLVIISEQA